MKTLTTRTLTGLLVIAIGAALLLSNLDVFSFGGIVSTWWPLVIVALGVLIFLNNKRNYLWAGIVVLLGVALQLGRLDIVDVNSWQLFWPATIILIGLSMILSRSRNVRPVAANNHNVSAILGGSQVKVQSEDFKGGKVTAVLGGASVDLRKAVIKKEATLDVFSFWGGIEVRVPEDIIVKNETSVILGGVEDQGTSAAAKDAPVLRILGDVIMAGVEIKR